MVFLSMSFIQVSVSFDVLSSVKKKSPNLPSDSHITDLKSAIFSGSYGSF